MILNNKCPRVFKAFVHYVCTHAPSQAGSKGSETVLPGLQILQGLWMKVCFPSRLPPFSCDPQMSLEDSALVLEGPGSFLSALKKFLRSPGQNWSP